MSYCLYALALKSFDLFLVNFDCSSDCLGARLRVPETHLVLFKKIWASGVQSCPWVAG